MKTSNTLLAALAAGVIATLAAAASPAGAQGLPFVPLAAEPPAKITLQPPVPTFLARGVAIIPYTTENFRILPVFGDSADDVTPRAGHLHVTVDDLPWHWADAGDSHGVVVQGLPPGRHKVLIELATPNHQVLTGQTATFVIPADAYAAGHPH